MSVQTQKPEDPGPLLRWPLSRAPFWSSGTLLFTVFVSVVVLSLARDLLDQIAAGTSLTESLGVGLVLIGCCLTLVFVLGRRWYVRLGPTLTLTFFDDHLEIPTNLESRFSPSIPYSEVISVEVVGHANNPNLLIETRKRIVVLPFAAFNDPNEPQKVMAELVRHIEKLPEAQALAQLANRRRKFVRRALAIRPIVTQTILGVLGVLFLNQILLGGLSWPIGPVRWGACTPLLVWEGEYFRLVSANFLHAHFVHIFVNGVALYFLGQVMERLVTRSQFIILYLGSGLVATLVTALLPSPSSAVGASGAIFGLLGGLAVYNARFRVELPLGFRQPLRWWVLVLSLNAALPLILPVIGFGRVAIGGHVAGFLGGAAITFLMVRRQQLVQVSRHSATFTRVLAGFLIAINLGGLGQAVVYAAKFGQAEAEHVTQVVLSDESLTADDLNAAAWFLAIDPQSSPKILELARRAAERAVAQENNPIRKAANLDTLATTLHRLKKYSEAVSIERQALSLVSDRTTASQLARFLVAQMSETGALLLTEIKPSAIEVKLSTDRDNDGEPDAFDIVVNSPIPQGVEFFIVIRRSENILGLLKIALGSLAGRQQRLDLGEGIGESLSSPRITLDLALIDVAPEKLQATDGLEWKVWDYDPEIDKLP